MGLAENPFGWMRVNGAEEKRGFNCTGPITQASALLSEAKKPDAGVEQLLQTPAGVFCIVWMA